VQPIQKHSIQNRKK